MEEIIQMAERLGKAIAASPQAVALHQASEALNAEKETVQVFQDYQQQARKIAETEDIQKPVEPEDKHKLEQLHKDLVAREAFKKFTAAQVDYVDVMRKVNDAIRKHLAKTES